jgi:hypothetical protein
MNSRELVDHILSGPVEIELSEPFRCDFNEILQALRSSVTIRSVRCYQHQYLEITEEQWMVLVQTLGCITGIRNLNLFFYCIDHAPRNFRPFQAIADAVNSAHSLRTLHIRKLANIGIRDPAGITALANALRQHLVLNSFDWLDLGCPQEAHHTAVTHDPVFRALPACTSLQKVTIRTKRASADAIRNLLQLRPGTILHLKIDDPDHWMAVADEIRQGRCCVRGLVLTMYRNRDSSDETDTAAIKAIATAIRRDGNLEGLSLRLGRGLSNEAGVALAEALTVNTHLRVVCLVSLADTGNPDRAVLGASAYEAFGAMLRVNTNLSLELPPFVNAIGDERRLDHYNQMRIEQRLNSAGRGTLLSVVHSPREEWVNALHELNTSSANESPAFHISCLYSLLRLNPNVCSSQVVEPTNRVIRKILAAKRMRRTWPWRKP